MEIVTNLNDDGPGSLRAAIAAASLGEEITFSVTGTITLTTAELIITQDVIITGPGSSQITVDGNNLFRVFNVSAGVITITGVEIFQGGGVTTGAGILNTATLTLEDVVVRECEASVDGGGIYNNSSISGQDFTVVQCRADGGNGGGIWTDGTLTTVGMNIFDCTCLQDGAGIYSDGATLDITGGDIQNNTASGVIGGGGIYATGTTDLTEVAIFDNTSNGNGLGIYNQFGTFTIIRCAIYNTSGAQGEIYNDQGTLNIDNSTVDGGGTNSLIHNIGVLDIRHCTLTNGNYGITSEPGAPVTIQNTIVCGNNGGVDVEVDTADLTSDGNNIFGSSTNPITPGPGDQFGVVIADVALGPLQDNGGPTPTRALLFGSVALDAGNNTGAPATDQRGTGFARVINGTIDIGAYEAQTTPEPPDPEPEPEPEPPQPSPEPEPSPSPSPVPTSSSLTPCDEPKQDCGFLGTPGDEDNPGIANLSAEAPDVDIFSNIPHPVVWLQPPLVGTGPGKQGFGEPNYTGPQPCTAIAQGANGTSMGGQIIVVCNPIVPTPQRPVIFNQWPQPPIIPAGPQEGTEMLPNEEQTCSAACADGGQFTVTVPEGVRYAKTVALANALARGDACSAAQSRVMCVSGTLDAGCAGATYTGVVTMAGAPTTRQGTPRTITWTVVSGSLPQGILLQSLTNSMNLLVSGIPTTGGNYEFTLRGTDPEGFSAQKLFELSIIEIVTELPDAPLNEPYSEQLFVTGGTGSSTFSLVLGMLPTGLDLSASGLLSGTPTEEGLFSFVVGVTRNGVTCTKQYVLDVSEVCGEFTIDTTNIDQVYGNGVSSTTVDAEGNSVCTQTVGPNLSSGALSAWGITIENICDHDIDVQLDYDFAINCTTPTNDFIPMDPPQAIASVTVAGYAPGISESVVGDSGIEPPGTMHSDSGTPSHTVTVGVGNTFNLTIICACQQQSTIGGAADLSFELVITVIT